MENYWNNQENGSSNVTWILFLFFILWSWSYFESWVTPKLIYLLKYIYYLERLKPEKIKIYYLIDKLYYIFM